MNKHDYIYNTIIPYFKTFVSQDIDAVIYDTEGCVVAATKKTAALLGFENETDLIGLSYKAASYEMIQNICNVTNPAEIEQIIYNCHTIAKLNDIVVVERRLVNYVDVVRYKNVYDTILVNHFPLFDTVGNVVATQAMGNTFYFFGFLDFISQLNTNPLSVSHAKLPIHLSEREHETLFLILNGFSQTDIASFLGVTRSTISSIISNQLSPKFGFYGANSKLLIAKAQKLGLQNYIPPSLYHPRIMVLDQEINEKYFGVS